MTKRLVSLSAMEAGARGLVTEIQGGIGLLRRLENLGIRPGVQIRKVSGQFMRGPVTLRIGNTQAALGFGMAQKIIVEITSGQ
jgi:ferrous iron transport protein A